MTLSVCDSVWVDWINTNTQYNHPRTRACVVQVLPRPSGLFYLHHWLLRWDEAPSAGLGCLSSPTSAVSPRQAIILLLTATCQSISTSETHTHTYSVFPSVSVAWLWVLAQWPGTDVRAAVCLFPSQEDAQQSNITQTYTNQTHSLHLCESYSHTHKTLVFMHPGEVLNLPCQR